MCFREMKMLKGGNKLKTFRIEACPAQTVIRGFARKKRVGGDRNPIAAGSRPLDQGNGIWSLARMLRKSREHIVVKLFDHMNEIVPGQTQLCVEISIEDL